MKNMKKTTVRSRTLTVLLLALSAALVLAGCVNPFEPIKHAGKTDTGTLSVSISRQGVGARTLYPETNFTKYELTFVEAGGAIYEPKTINQGGTESFKNFPAGNWTITAVGYVTINGTEYAAAEGKCEVNIEAGKSTETNIAISASQEGSNGYFYYDIIFPDENVDTATLTLMKYNSDEPLVQVNLTASPSGYVDSGDSGSGLAPGYYLLQIDLRNEHHYAGMREIVHIYANMETKAEFEYTDKDFIKIITLEGTITATVGNFEVKSLDIYAHLDNGTQVGMKSVVPYSAGADWRMFLPVFNEETTISFDVVLFDNSGYPYRLDNIDSYPVFNNSVPGIKLEVEKSFITLDGTITAKIGDADPKMVIIDVYEEDGEGNSTRIHEIDFSSYSPDLSWSIDVLAYDEETTIFFNVNLYDDSGGSYIVKRLSPTPVYNESVSSISLEATLITLGGTITAKIGDAEPEKATITAYLGGNNPVGSTTVDPYSSGAEWSIAVPVFDEETTVFFNVELFDHYGKSHPVYNVHSLQVSDTPDSAISLIANVAGEIPTITLQGKIGDVTVNDEPFVGMIAIRARWKLNGSDVQHSSSFGYFEEWSIPTIPLTELAYPIDFDVIISIYGVEQSLEIPYARINDIEGVDIANIDLGDVNFTLPFLSGTIGTVSIDESIIEERVYISAYNQHNEALGWTMLDSSGKWSIVLAPSDIQNGDEISIVLLAYGDDFFIHKTLITYIYSGNNIPDITLDDVNITTRTVRGTVINLPPGEYLLVYALSKKSESPGYPFILDRVGEGEIEDNAWEIKVSSDAPEDLWFEVDMWNEDMYTIFATKSSMSSSSIVVLDIETMDSISL